MTDLETLARELWQARRDGHTVPLPVEAPSLDEAYRVQEAIAALAASRRAGFKVGSTSKAAQARLGTSEPGAGPVLERFCFRDAGGGVQVQVWPAHHLHVEAEFAFEMEAVAPRAQGWSRSEVVRAVRAFRPALEIVGTRYESGLTGLGRALTTADGGVNVALIAGPASVAWEDTDLAAQSVRLAIDGEQLATGCGADALGHPLNVLEWLLAHLGRRGIALEAGEIVSTGTCTGLIPVAPGNHLHADFGVLGSVGAQLVAASSATRR